MSSGLGRGQGRCGRGFQYLNRLRVAAAVALGSGGFIDCHRALHTYLGFAEGDVRAAACHALGTLAAADTPLGRRPVADGHPCGLE